MPATATAARPSVSASAQALPHRSKYLLLAIDFLRRYLELHLELVEAVEREFDAGSAGESGSEAASA